MSAGTMASHYDEQWQHWPAGPGPINWRGSHHGQPHPAVSELFDLTDEYGMSVELHVSPGRPFGSPGNEHRRLGLLSVSMAGHALASADAGLLTLPMAASTCRTRLLRHV